ncbi:MAG: phosphomethylpyrimidine synthase ThiC, partial [Chloroflexi bacterium]|nr:phosphomethylpyrimidine synthase ThiC [Chloroflexota bacterium]
MTQVFAKGLQVQGKSNFPASKKVYTQGSRPDIRVPWRQVTLTPTSGRFGDVENAPLSLYDTSGPYTDEAIDLDVRKGLP